MNTAAREVVPSERAWYAAVAEAMDLFADRLDPLFYSQRLGNSRLDDRTRDAVRALADGFVKEFEAAADADPSRYSWKKEFELATQYRCLCETLDDPAATADTALAVEGVRTGDVSMLFQWSARNNAEARTALEAAAGVGPRERTEPAGRADKGRDAGEEDVNYQVPVDPRSLAPSIRAVSDFDEEVEPQRANSRRSMLNRQIAIAGETAAAAERPSRPLPDIARPAEVGRTVRSALPGADRATVPNRTDRGR